MGSSFESILAEGSLSYLSVYSIIDIYIMIGTLVLCSLFAASQQMSLAHYEQSRYNEPVHHAPGHGDVHVSGRYQQDNQVHVSGVSGATRIVDSGNAYHAAAAPKPAAAVVTEPYRPAPTHSPLYRPAYHAPAHSGYKPGGGDVHGASHYKPGHYAPAHGDVQVSGGYQLDSQVLVSGTAGATRIVDSGISYHAHQNPYRPAPVHPYPFRPVHYAPVHGEVHVSGIYKQGGFLHVSGTGATRVIDSGSHHRYQPAPVMYNPQPDLPAPVVHKPYVPAPVHKPYFLFRRARSVPDHQEEDVHVSGSYEQENEVHVSGSAGTTVILDYDDDHSYGGHSSYAHEPASEYESHHAPADDVNVSGSYKQESEVHVSGAGATRVS